ncbi:MAG: hypothetical protein JSS07_12285, partial [Proteobacteria bacterium]|nr:hypothetical protein [Pseudomonadota bacterium]
PGGGVSGGEHGQGDCSAYCFERPQTGQLAFGGAPPCELITGPFECEPEVSVFGDLGRRMAALIEEIARALRMDSRAWPHAGAFAINAARMLRARAVLAARADPGKVQDARPAAMGTGNLGGLHAVIAISPGIAQLRSLGAVAKQVEQLDDLVLAALGPSSTFLSDCGKQQFGARWALHYLKEYTPAAESAGYEIFVQACRVAMLQLLAASRQGIEWMQSQFETFYAGIEGLMLGPTKRLVELWRLREQILQAELYDFVVGVDDGVKTTPGADPKAPRRGLWDATKAGAEASVRVGYQAWRDARDWWAHDDTLGHARTELAARGRIAGTVERQADGTFAVRETRGGEERLWTLAELDGAIAFTRQTVVTVNPIVKHMTNLEGSAAAFANGPQATKAFVRRTVDRMLQANKEATAAVREDAMFAFRTARFSEDWKEPTIAGTGVRLGQIHAMAHEAIGDAFTGSRIYLQGVKFLFGSEQGREALMPMLELAITIGAFVLFAPAGFALSAAFATSRYEDATGHVALTQGLIEPGEVFDHVEAELELFMSHFEIAMLVVPAARPIARRGIAALRTLRQQSLRAGLRTLGRRATAHILEEFALALKGELAHAFVSQLATAKLLEPILQLVLEPVFAVIGSEAELGQKAAGGTPSAEPPGALAARMQLLADYGDVDIDLDPAAPAEDPP